MKKIIFFAVLNILLFTACSEKKIDLNTFEPVLNNGKKWRIAYYEGGHYIDYYKYLLSIIEGLKEHGWITSFEYNPTDSIENDNTEYIWKMLSEKAVSDYIEFSAENYWSSDWDDSLRASNKEKTIQRLSSSSGIDLIIAMGTWAGEDLANDKHSVPVLVFSSSDPIGADIVKSAENSGYLHVFAHCDTSYYQRQIKLFHDYVGFKTLGVAYENSKEGRIYGNLKALFEMSEELGFDIEECHAAYSGVSEEESRQELLECYTDLAPKIDAVWISSHRGANPKFMPEILEPFMKNKTASWVELDYGSVHKGVLMGLSRENIEPTGKWSAEIMIKVLRGSSPGSLEQVYEIPHRISLNLKTAEIIGLELTEEQIKNAAETYENIER